MNDTPLPQHPPAPTAAPAYDPWAAGGSAAAAEPGPARDTDYTVPDVQVVPGAAMPYQTAPPPAQQQWTPPPALPDPIGGRPLVGELVILPSGGWVQLRSTDDLRSRHRDHVMQTLPMDEGSFTMSTVTAMQRAAAEVMIVGWSLPYAPDAVIPSQHTGPGSPLDDLMLRDEDALMAALRPVMDVLTPKKVDPADHADPNSPTGPEGASGRV